MIPGLAFCFWARLRDSEWIYANKDNATPAVAGDVHLCSCWSPSLDLCHCMPVCVCVRESMCLCVCLSVSISVCVPIGVDCSVPAACCQKIPSWLRCKRFDYIPFGSTPTPIDMTRAFVAGIFLSFAVGCVCLLEMTSVSAVNDGLDLEEALMLSGL
jgi:hypothetical protein